MDKKKYFIDFPITQTNEVMSIIAIIEELYKNNPFHFPVSEISEDYIRIEIVSKEVLDTLKYNLQMKQIAYSFSYI